MISVTNKKQNLGSFSQPLEFSVNFVLGHPPDNQVSEIGHPAGILVLSDDRLPLSPTLFVMRSSKLSLNSQKWNI